MHRYITAKEFEDAKSSFISFPEIYYKFISENIKKSTTICKLQTELKWKAFDKTAFLYKINSNIFIQPTFEQMYWIYTDGINFYCVWYRTNGGVALEEDEYTIGKLEELMFFLNIAGQIDYTKDEFLNFQNLQLSLQRDKKINEILS